MASPLNTPLLQDFFVKNIGKFYAYDFLAMVIKILLAKFRKISKALAALWSCHVTSSGQGVNENLRFSKFSEHISKCFQYFFMKSLL